MPSPWRLRPRAARLQSERAYHPSASLRSKAKSISLVVNSSDALHCAQKEQLSINASKTTLLNVWLED